MSSEPQPTAKPTPPTVWQELGQILSPKTSVLFAASLLTPAAAFMLYPFLTIYFTHTLGLAIAVAGALLSIRFLSSATLSFVGGWASDRYGLVPVYVLAGVVTAAALWLMAFQHSGLVLALLLVVVGISAATVNANVRGLANLGVPAAHRGTVQNYVHWLNNLGMAVALPFSAFLLHAGSSRLPFVVAAIGYLAMAALVAWAFRSDAAPAKTPSVPARSTPWGILRQDRAFRLLMAAFLLWVAVEMQFESNIPLDLARHFPQGAELYGTLGALDLVIVFVLQLLVSHWLAKATSPWYGYLGFLLLGGLIVGGLWQTVVGWTLAIILLSVGEVFSISQIMALMGVLPREGQQGSYFSLFGMVQGLGTFLAYALGSTAYQGLGPGTLFALCLPAAALAAVLYRQAHHVHVQAAAPPAPLAPPA